MSSGGHTGRDSYVLLSVGRRRFALPSRIVSELAPPVRLHTFPQTTPLIAGVIVRRGRIVPVYDAGPVLIGRESPTHRFYLVASRNFGKVSEPAAIPVNGECELANGERLPPDAGHAPYIAGKLAIGEDEVEILDFEALLTSQPVGENPAAPEEARA